MEEAMLKIVLLLLSAGMNSNAIAKVELVEIGNGFGGDKVFIYPNTIKKSGSSVTMWDMFNSGSPQNLAGYSPYLSKVSQVQYDCEEKKMRTRFTNIYSEKDGKGARILAKDTSTLLDWQPVVAGTAHEALFEYACGKK
jgi:Surface-adhesin protein E